jgi:hypothetical protein
LNLFLVAERQVLGNPVGVRGIHGCGLAKIAAAARRFIGKKVAATGAGAQYLAAGADLKALGDRLSRFVAFRATHNQFAFY